MRLRRVLTIALAGALAVVALTATWTMTRPGADLSAVYAQRLQQARQGASSAGSAPLMRADAATLPAPVRRWVERSGAIGKPPVHSVHIVYQAEMFQTPGGPGLPGPSEQFNSMQPTRRLFFMASRMSGLPVAVLHDYEGDQAAMQVRVARLFDAVNLRGNDLARTETVTLLNDLCFWSPSAFLDPKLAPQFQWQAVDDSRAEVRFTQGAHTVQATLLFNSEGDLVDFTSDDRGLLGNDGRMQRYRWSTPMRDFQVFEGRRVPTRGEAIWHRPEGPFMYGRFEVQSIRFGT